MALARTRRGDGGMNYWPGFVDALSTMLLALIFRGVAFGEQHLPERREVVVGLGDFDAVIRAADRHQIEVGAIPHGLGSFL